MIREEIDAHQAKQEARPEEVKPKNGEIPDMSLQPAVSSSNPQAEGEPQAPNGIHDPIPNGDASLKDPKPPPPENRSTAEEALPKPRTPRPGTAPDVGHIPEPKDDRREEDKTEEKQVDDHGGEELVEGQEDDVIY